MKFINRAEELGFLARMYNSGKPELLVVYGRRRVGKTELLTHFAKDKRHLYFLASETTEKESLVQLFGKAGELFNDDILTMEKSWENLFSYLAKKKERFMLIIDEFPYLAAQERGVPSIFQKGWDTHLKDSKVFLVLCGSSMSMMEKYALAYRAPLYGRRTGQWKVEPLRIREVWKFFPTYCPEDVMRVYAALDSIPAYLVKFDHAVCFWENVEENMLKKGSFLYDEVDFLLRQELREPKVYKSILAAMVQGNTKFGEILSVTGMDKSKLFVYLSNLESLGIIEKRSPLLDSPKSKRGRYIIKDNFFKFWFRYVMPNKSMLEEGRAKQLLEKVKSDYNAYIGSLVFENACGQLLFSTEKLLPFIPEKTGGHWGSFTVKHATSEFEIDLVALNSQERKIMFVECKLQYETLSSVQKKCIHLLKNIGFEVEVHKIVDHRTKTVEAVVENGTKRILVKQLMLT